MNMRLFFHILFFVVTSSLFSYNKHSLNSTFRGKVSFLNTVEAKNSFITYVMIDGKKYIVKQKKRSEKKQLALLRDTLAAYIAKDLNIAHQVDMISYDKIFPGKIYPNLPAIILTIAQGDTIRNQPDGIYGKLRINQRWRAEYLFEERGLTRSIIEQMTWHEQLPLIIALDLFIGNSDRHGANLFYDPKTDTFCAIDMDNTFNKDLCELACQKLLFILKKDKSFSEKELIALKSLKKYLYFFVTKYSPEFLIKKLHHFARKAGFSPASPLYDDHIEKNLLSYKDIIIKSHASAYNLIDLLDRIISEKK